MDGGGDCGEGKNGGCGEGAEKIFSILEMENNQTNRQARSDPALWEQRCKNGYKPDSAFKPQPCHSLVNRIWVRGLTLSVPQFRRL